MTRLPHVCHARQGKVDCDGPLATVSHKGGKGSLRASRFAIRGSY